MKRKNVFMIIFLTVMLAFGCAMPYTTPNQNPEKVEQGEAWPFDNVTIATTKTPKMDSLPGTYVRVNTYFKSYEAISFYPNGKVVSIPYTSKNRFGASHEPVKNGDWALIPIDEKTQIVIALEDARYLGYTMPLKDEGKTIGFAFDDYSGYSEGFVKISDSNFNMSIYDQNYIEGLYAQKNDYDELYGFQLFKDGRMIYYGTNKSIEEYAYKLNPSKCLIRISNSRGEYDEYNYAMINGKLCINSIFFQKVR